MSPAASAPGVRIAGERATVRFDDFGLPAYDLFVRVKGLPEKQLAWDWRLEWDSVRISGDFRAPKATEPGGEPEIPPADARLAYVAVTRAKKLLDREGLAWVDRFLPLASVAGSAGQS